MSGLGRGGWSVLVWSLCGLNTFAQEAHIHGVVTDGAGNRVQAATLAVHCGEQTPRVTHTDADGKWDFSRVSPGCLIAVDAPGFETLSHAVMAGEHDLDLTLNVQKANSSVTVIADTGYVAVTGTTSTKTDTPLVEVPQAISVVTRAQMDEQQIQSVPDALRYSAGIVPEIRGMDTGSYEVLMGRGFAMEEYLDGLRLPNAGAGFLVPSLDPEVLDRVEILHGPASVLFGQAYPAGLVNLGSKQPRTVPLRSVSFTPGAYNRLQGTWDFSGPLDSNQHFLYRVTGLARHRDSQVNFNEEERYVIAPSLSWRPSEKTSLTGLFDYQYDPHTGFYNLLPAAGTVLPNLNGTIPTSFDPGEPDFDKHSRRLYAGGYLFSHAFDRTWTLDQNFRYLHLADSQADVYQSSLLADDRIITRYSFVNNEHLDAVTLDTHAAASLNSHENWRQTALMGVDYQTLPYEEAYGFDFSAPNLDMFAPVYNQVIPKPSYAGIDHVKFWQTGLYGQDQLRYKRLAVTVGGREDWTSTRDHEAISNTLQAQSDHAFTGRAGIVYEARHGLNPYFSYSTSFQPTLGVDANGQNFKPTTGQQYEVGLKYQLDHTNAFVTVSAFNLTEQNVTTADPTHPQFSVQTGSIRSRGIEVEGHANLASGINLIASYSFLDNVVTSSSPASSVFAIAQGNALYGTPSNIASLWADRTFGIRGSRGLNLGSGVRFIGQTYGDDANSFVVPSFTLVDLAAHYDLPSRSGGRWNWQLSAKASNVADRRYVSVCLDADAGCFYGARRDVLGTVALKW